ncbi:MAG: hypothetical protein ACLTDR_05325 [Adlercreutzia equolifaciens]
MEDPLFPKALKSIPHPPARLYGVGCPGALGRGAGRRGCAPRDALRARLR